MKKIMFAIGSLYGGGAERVVSIWASELEKKGYDVSVLLYCRAEKEYKLEKNVKIYTIAHSEKECNSYSILKRVSLIRKSIKTEKPDVLVSFLPMMQIYCMLATIGLRVKRVDTVRCNPADIYSLVKSPFLWKLCFSTSSAVITQASGQADFFSKHVRDKSTIIPNPLSEESELYKKESYTIDCPRLIAAGRLDDQKNYKMMIDAVNRAFPSGTDFSLNIFGEGKKKEELQKYITENELEDRVHLCGRTDKIYEQMKQSDIFLMSSDYEGLPNALIEAMTIGLPCIATNCPTGPKDLIDDGKNGFLVPVGDYVKMSECICKVLAMNTETRQELGNCAREYILDYCGVDNSIEMLVTLLAKI